MKHFLAFQYDLIPPLNDFEVIIGWPGVELYFVISIPETRLDWNDDGKEIMEVCSRVSANENHRANGFPLNAKIIKVRQCIVVVTELPTFEDSR